MKTKRILGSFVLCLIFLLTLSTFAFGARRAPVTGQSIIKIGEDAIVPRLTSAKDVVSIGGSVYVGGDVENDVVALGGSVTLRPTAKVNGDVVSIGGKVIKEAGATVGGEITELSAIQIAPFTKGIQNLGGEKSLSTLITINLLVFIGLLALALVVVSFFPHNVGKTSALVEKSWLKTLLYGVLGSILIVPIIVLLGLSILGIPLIPVFILIVACAMILALVGVAQLVGKKVTRAFRRPNRPMITEVVVGLILLGIIFLIPVLGWIIKGVVLTMGFGGVILSKFGTRV